MGAQEYLNKIREKFKPVSTARCQHCDHVLTIEELPNMTVEICENCFNHSKITDHSDCCKSSNYIHVQLVTSGGAVQVKEQCSNCGNVKPSAVGGYSKEEKAKLPILNEPLRQLRYATIRDQYSTAHKKLNAARLKKYDSDRSERRNNWMAEYSKYLNSPEWKAKRDLVIRRDNNICQACLRNYATQVHHKSYDFVDLAGSEPCFDLVAVCTPCHERIEQMKAERRKLNNS